MASHLSRVFFRTYHTLLHGGVALVFSSLFTRFYDRPSPWAHLTFLQNVANLRTIIVIADIDRGLYNPPPSTLNTIFIAYYERSILLRLCIQQHITSKVLGNDRI